MLPLIKESSPKRKLIYRYFLSLCMNYGMDAAIMDPLDRKLTSAISATDVHLLKIVSQGDISKPSVKKSLKING